MPYANLDDAGADAYVNLYGWYQNGAVAPTLQTKLLSFCTTIQPSFPANIVVNYPIVNWIAIIMALATNMGVAAPTLTQLTDSSKMIYGICLLTATLNNAGQITNAQATVMLNAFNNILRSIP